MISHRDLLEARYDGPIPRAELRAADEADAANARASPPRAQPIPRHRYRSAFELVRAMAELMVLRASAEGSCSDADLACAGFTRAEMDAYAEDARTLAARVTADRRR